MQNGENQKSFRIRRPGQIGSYPQPNLIAFIQSWSTYRQQAARVDKYSEKLKKLLVFSAFQSVYPIVRMTNALFCVVRFFFCFAVQ